VAWKPIHTAVSALDLLGVVMPLPFPWLFTGCQASIVWPGVIMLLRWGWQLWPAGRFRGAPPRSAAAPSTPAVDPGPQFSVMPCWPPAVAGVWGLETPDGRGAGSLVGVACQADPAQQRGDA